MRKWSDQETRTKHFTG